MLDYYIASDRSAEHVLYQWQQIGKQLPTIAFCSTLVAAKSLIATFEKHGVKVAMVTNRTQPSIRQSLFDEFNAHKINVLALKDVGCEKIEFLHTAKCCLFLKPKTSQCEYYRQLELLTRNAGEEKGIVIDFVDLVFQYGGPEQR